MEAGLVNPYISKSAGWWDDSVNFVGNMLGFGIEDREALGLKAINMLRKLPLEILRQIIQKVQRDPNSGLTEEDRALDPQQWKLSNPGINRAFLILSDEAVNAINQFNNSNPNNTIDPNSEDVGLTDYDNLSNALYGKHINSVIRDDPYLQGLYAKVLDMKIKAETVAKNLYGTLYKRLIDNSKIINLDGVSVYLINQDDAGTILNALLEEDPDKQASVLGNITPQVRDIISRSIPANTLQDLKNNQIKANVLSGPMPIQALEIILLNPLDRIVPNTEGGIVFTADNKLAKNNTEKISLLTTLSDDARNFEYLFDTDLVITDPNGNVISGSLNNEIFNDPMLLSLALSYSPEQDIISGNISTADIAKNVQDNPNLQNALAAFVLLKYKNPLGYQNLLDTVQLRALSNNTDVSSILKPLIQSGQINTPADVRVLPVRLYLNGRYMQDLNNIIQEQDNVLNTYKKSLPSVYLWGIDRFTNKSIEDYRAPFVAAMASISGTDTILYKDPLTGKPEENSVFDRAMAKTSPANRIEAAVRGRNTIAEDIQNASENEYLPGNLLVKGIKSISDAYFNKGLPFLGDHNIYSYVLPNSVYDKAKSFMGGLKPAAKEMVDGGLDWVADMSTGNFLNSAGGIASSSYSNRNRSLGSNFDDYSRTLFDLIIPAQALLNAALDLPSIAPVFGSVIKGTTKGVLGSKVMQLAIKPGPILRSVNKFVLPNAAKTPANRSWTRALVVDNVPYLPVVYGSHVINDNILTPRITRQQTSMSTALTRNLPENTLKPSHLKSPLWRVNKAPSFTSSSAVPSQAKPPVNVSTNSSLSMSTKNPFL